MSDDVFYRPFVDDAETGAATGDHRENDASCAGFTEDEDRIWRSQFQRVNQLADTTYEQVRPAYEFGHAAARDARYRDRAFEAIETDLENGWLNVQRAAGGARGQRSWASVRAYARAAFEAGRTTGFVQGVSAYGDSKTPERPSYSDPVAGGLDPTSPGSAEQTLAAQQEDNAPAPFNIGSQGGFGDRNKTARDVETGEDV